MPKITCPKCEAELEVDAESAGQRVQCADCDHVFTATFRQKKSSKRVADDDDEDDDRPRRKSSRRRDDDDDDEDEYRRRPKKSGAKANGMAVAGMICGIVGLVIELPAFGVSVFGVACCCFNIVSWPMHALAALLAVLGLVFGFLGFRKPKGKGMGITGIALGGITLILAILGLVLGILGVAVMGAKAAAMPTFPAPQAQPFPQPAPLPQPLPQPRPKPLPKPRNNL